jgi:DNA-binding IclR family transcriptional regulator
MTGRRSPVRRTARLFASLARSPVMSVVDASRQLGLPYATCHRLLRILVEEGLVERGAGKSYRLAVPAHDRKPSGKIA